MAPAAYLEHLTRVVLANLQDQLDWTQLQMHSDESLPRMLVSGLPPRRLYIHPDEQIEIIAAERALGHGQRIAQPPEFEWVLPMHLDEGTSISQFAAVFDAIGALPPGSLAEAAADGDGDAQWRQWRGVKRLKRLVLAIVQDDSTVVYYVMHDGIVKPRQN